MRGLSERERATMRAFVERVAGAFGAATVLVDGDLDVGPGMQVRVASAEDALPEGPFDIVVSVDAPARVAGWQERLAALAHLARRAMVVFARNDARIGSRSGATSTELAGVLWQAGRVREHAYLGAPRVVARADVMHAPAGAVVLRTARLHAFVVDTAPRTPQARRRLRTVPGSGGEANKT